MSLYLINNKHEVSKLDIIGSFFYIGELLNINNVHFHADMCPGKHGVKNLKYLTHSNIIAVVYKIEKLEKISLLYKARTIEPIEILCFGKEIFK